MPIPPPRLLSLSTALAIVVRRTQRLPVALIPEELVVAAVRDDVVDQRCGNDPIFLQAFHAERMASQVGCPRSLPTRPVAALR